MIGWLVWVLTRTEHLRVKARVEFQNRLLEKISSAEDFVQMMRSEEGRAFIEAVSVDNPSMREQILGSAQKGVIFTAIGAGGLLLRWIFPMGYGVFILASVLAGAVGVGFLISSAVSYRLSKSWGLLSETKRIDYRDRDASLFRH